MPIETNCPGCGQRLRVADEHAGKVARCPGCAATYTVPSPTPTPSATTQAYWSLKLEDGREFGPVSKAELDQWLAEGRISPGSQLKVAGETDWKWATLVYPQLLHFSRSAGQPSASPSQSGPTVSFDPGNPNNPYASPQSPYMAPMGLRPSVRFGPSVISLAVVSLFTSLCCFPVSIVTGVTGIVLGVADLRMIRDGRLDPGARALVLGGVIVASVSVAIGVCVMLLSILGGIMK